MLTSDFGLSVFGVLGLLEIIANWDDSIRELISESNIETYVKPVFAFLMTYSICTPEQMQVLSAVVDGLPGAVPATGGLAAVESVTSTVSTAVAAVDVTSTTNAVSSVAATVPSEGSAVTAAFSSLFCGGVTFGLCKVRSAVVSSVRELDPENALHLNSLLTAFEEGSWLVALPLLLVFPILALILMLLFALLGWAFSRPLKELAQKRRAYWDSVGRDGLLCDVRKRAIAIFVVGGVLSSIPVVGYLVTVIALNLFVFSVLALYEKRSSRFLLKMLLRFLKLLVFLVAIVFSSIPFLGILLLVPYLISYLIREKRIRREV